MYMKRYVITGIAAAAAVMSLTAVDYNVVPDRTFPAEGESVAELPRVRIYLKKGFGTVGYDRDSDGTAVYLENEAGERIPLNNMAGEDPMPEAGWDLEAMDGNADERVHTYKDKLYNRLFTRTLGWNGGDGVFTVALPDGNVFWTFNDSFYGVADAETRARGACSFPRNTIMVQQGERDGLPITTDEALVWLAKFQQTTDSSAPGYYKAYTHLDHPSAKDYNDDGIAQDVVYWSGDGTISADGKLKMLWNGVNTSKLESLGTALVTYRLKGEPGDRTYLQIATADHTFLLKNPYSYGSTLWEDEDGHIYLYSSTGNGTWLGNDPIVARTTGTELDSRWEYLVKNEAGEMVWQTKYPTQEEVQRSGIAPGQGSFSLPWVIKKGDSYFMFAQTFPFGQEMAVMRSDHPWGPFTDKKTLITFPNPLDELQHDPWGDKYRFLYMLNLHPALSRTGELVISTNTDPAEDGPGAFWRNFNSPGSCDWYRPFFYRVYGWEHLFDGTPLGARDYIEFAPAAGTPALAPGRYKFVCEQGVFGNERYETSGKTDGTANSRIEISFTLTDGAGVETVTEGSSVADATYHTVGGVKVAEPTAGSVYVRSEGGSATKVLVH